MKLLTSLRAIQLDARTFVLPAVAKQTCSNNESNARMRVDSACQLTTAKVTTSPGFELGKILQQCLRAHF